MKFIDLFAGLGGFHVGLENLGHECVFACELDKGLRNVYEKNFGIRPEGDIREVKTTDVPAHDILCAGFPCQPFSKAGAQPGFDCPKNGTLFDEVTRIVAYHKPEFVMLENVPNLKRHDDGKTWQQIYDKLKELGYDTDANLYSPHEFGIPQIRQRVMIVARRNSLDGFEWPKPPENPNPSLTDYLEKKPSNARALSKQVIDCLNVWQRFLDAIPKDDPLPSWPIWSMEFGATYPFEDESPYKLGKKKLREFRGCHGQKLTDNNFSNPFDGLPSYARVEEDSFPTWKKSFIRSNRAFYQKHKKVIKEWMPQILEFPASLQKFEWNCQGANRNLWELVIQFRASGVRVKRPSTSPSLVAMTTTQIPIIGWEKRYMTPGECAKLQSLGGLKAFPETDTATFRALGNAVNAKMVEIIAGQLIGPVNKKKSGHVEKASPSRSEPHATRKLVTA
jgi:DNA (cytosine-5)-methyltransferase 1